MHRGIAKGTVDVAPVLRLRRVAHQVELPPRRRRRTGAGETDQLVAALARWYWEVLDGRRDPRQLRRLLSPACLERVRHAAGQQHRARCAGDAGTQARSVVRRTVVAWVGDVCEGVALVQRGPRTTAVTVVLQRHDGHLRVVDLARPEAGTPALAPPRT